MVTLSEAREIVLEYLRRQPSTVRYDVVVRDELTRTEDFGWVFFYDSREYVRTRDTHYALIGNAPIIVDSETGRLSLTGTGLPIEHFIDEYRRARKSR